MIKKFNVKKTKNLRNVNNILKIFLKKPSKKRIITPSEAENILIIDFSLIGDMVMDIPFLKTIRRNCPKAKVTMVSMKWAGTVLGDQGLVDEFIIFNGKDCLSSPAEVVKHFRLIRKTLNKINEKHYDIGFEPKGDLRHTLFMRFTHCDRTVSYNYTGGEYLITDSFTPRADTEHLIDEKLDLLEMAGFRINDEDRIPSFKVTGRRKAIADRFIRDNDLQGRDIIGIHPGASNRIKQFRHYPELVEKLSGYTDDDTVFCVFEGPGEEDVALEVTEKLKLLGQPYIRVKRSIKDYVAIVGICGIMICNDSAAGHLAAAYGIPAVVIFGPVEAKTALPRGHSQIEYVSHDMNCKPCTLPDCPLGTEQCISDITADEVVRKYMNIKK